ncbi:hypothetical protein BGZ90_004261, partial [Linnemannia elongata]
MAKARIEKRHKGFLKFLIHHVITCLFIGLSYSFDLALIGHIILCAMDLSDIVLTACKILEYCQKGQTANVG